MDRNILAKDYVQFQSIRHLIHYLLMYKNIEQ